MHLKNPPIVEVWVGFLFTPSQEKTKWDLESAMPFFEQFRATLSHVQIQKTEELTILERTPSGKPKKICLNAMLASLNPLKNLPKR